MNIFYLHPDPTLCAQQYCDKLLTRMILETGQMLSTRFNGPYKPLTRTNHPSYMWMSRTRANRTWTYNLFEAMSHEYFYRFNKVHKTWETISSVITRDLVINREFMMDNGSLIVNDTEYTNNSAPFYPPPQVVPRQYKVSRGRLFALGKDLGYYQSLATIMAYRRFYLHDKAPFCKWTKREAPTWFTTKNLWDIMKEMIRIEGLSPPESRSRISENGEPFYALYNRAWVRQPARTREEPTLTTINGADATPWNPPFGARREEPQEPQLVLFEEEEDDIPF